MMSSRKGMVWRLSELGVWIAIIVALALACVLFAVGCSAIGGLFKPNNVVAPPYAKAEHRSATSQPSGERTWNEWFAEGWGPGASGPDMKEVDTPPLEVTPKGGVQIGGGGAELDGASGKTGPRLLAVYIIGGFVLAAGILVAIYVNWRLGVLIAGGAIAAVGAIQFLATYPWVLWIAGALGVAFLAYIVWRAKKQADGQITLQTLVGAISTLDDDLAAAVKAAIAKYAGRNADTVKTVVGEVKREENVQ